MDFDPQAGHEQKGRSPAVIVSNDRDLPVLRGPSSQRLKLFSMSGSIRASSSHFSRSENLSASMPVERSRTVIHSAFVNALRPSLISPI
jgi:hypothetical protein